jgi:hypothetical protein
MVSVQIPEDFYDYYYFKPRFTLKNKTKTDSADDRNYRN